MIGIYFYGICAKQNKDLEIETAATVDEFLLAVCNSKAFDPRSSIAQSIQRAIYYIEIEYTRRLKQCINIPLIRVMLWQMQFSKIKFN